VGVPVGFGGSERLVRVRVCSPSPPATSRSPGLALGPAILMGHASLEAGSVCHRSDAHVAVPISKASAKVLPTNRDEGSTSRHGESAAARLS
jgi:hypothetical protein